MQRVLLDACVLVPYNLCDLLLRLAEAELFIPLWSAEILKETERALVEKIGLDSGRAGSRVAKMNAAFEGAEVPADEALVSQMTCDEKDRHVLASAVTGDADVLVTANIRDFPEASAEPETVAYRWLGSFHGVESLRLAEDLSYSGRAFTSFVNDAGDLNQFALAQRVHRAVDAPDDVAFMKLIPSGHRLMRTLHPGHMSGRILILVRVEDSTWRVWGLSDSYLPLSSMVHPPD